MSGCNPLLVPKSLFTKRHSSSFRQGFHSVGQSPATGGELGSAMLVPGYLPRLVQATELLALELEIARRKMIAGHDTL